MKKIILVFDGSNFSTGALEFARRLNELQPVMIVGVFLPQTNIANMWSYAESTGVINSIPLVEDEEAIAIENNMKIFENLCKDNKIQFSIHKDFYNLALPELKRESAFADLIIIGSEVFYKEIGTKGLNYCLKELLHDVHCPVLIVPEQYNFPESNIIAYDGSEESLFAMKQFAYLFPEFCRQETVLIYAAEGSDKDFPEKYQIKEFASAHFPKLSFFTLNVDPKKYLATWIADKRSSLLVSGSFGRSGISQLFKKSFVQDVIADHKLPVFIAHK